MKKSFIAALVAGALSAAAIASAEKREGAELSGGQPDQAATVSTQGTLYTLTPISTIYTIPWWYFQPTWKCEKADHSAATSTDLASPYLRHILVLSTGYQDADHAQFFTDFETIIDRMANAGSVWSTVKRDRLIWCGYWTGGGPVGDATASFGAKVMKHPIRAYALSLSNDAVYAKIAAIQAANTIPSLKPLGALVIFNDFQSDITANAAPPNFVNKSFGVAKMNRDDLSSGYIATHELGHAALNFLDEYVETGLENTNIRSFDVATPLVLFDWTWGGFTTAISNLAGDYTYELSEILAANGNNNITLAAYPSTVYSPISAPLSYPYEHGFFFGRGTYHQNGKNLMNSNAQARGTDDGFDYAMSANQWATIETAFGSGAYRANDRLRNAGPLLTWFPTFGSNTTVMMYDGDKRHQFHPTKLYQVQVGWYERVWYTAWWGPIPYPAYNDVWHTAQKNIVPNGAPIYLKSTLLYGLANLAQATLCGVGVTEIPKPDGTKFQLCETQLSDMAADVLPTLVFYTPYSTTEVPASQWFTTYYWHFASHNGTTWSGYTGWSSFYRSF